MFSFRVNQALPVFLLLLIFGSSCSKGGHSFRLIEEEGVTVALTTGGSKYEGELFIYEKMLELKQDPDQPGSIIYMPSEITRDEQGYYYVIDSGDRRIAVFDNEGYYSHSIGRRGGGPGEFNYLQLQSVRGGVISIFDRVLRRITRFQTDGTLIDVTSTPALAGYYFTNYFYLPGDHHLIIVSRWYQEEELFQNTLATMLNAESDTLWSIETEEVQAGFVNNADSWEYFSFGCFPMSVFQPEVGIIVSSGRLPEFDIYNLVGSHQLKVKIEMIPEPVTSEERTQIRSDYVNELEEATQDIVAAYYTSLLEKLRFQEYKAPWAFVEVDDAGFIWLRKPLSGISHLRPFLTYPLPDWEKPPAYLVVSPEGEYLGNSVRPKAAFSKSHNRRLLSIEIDETGAPRLIIYRIIPAVEGLIYP